MTPTAPQQSPFKSWQFWSVILLSAAHVAVATFVKTPQSQANAQRYLAAGESILIPVLQAGGVQLQPAPVATP